MGEALDEAAGRGERDLAPTLWPREEICKVAQRLPRRRKQLADKRGSIPIDYSLCFTIMRRGGANASYCRNGLTTAMPQ